MKTTRKKKANLRGPGTPEEWASRKGRRIVTAMKKIRVFLYHVTIINKTFSCRAAH